MKTTSSLKSSILRGLLSLFFLVAMVSNAWGETIVLDFEDNTAHRTSGTNSYSSNSYTENGVTITMTYFDAVSSTKVSGSYNATGRVAKNTTNSPVLLIGPIDIKGKKVTGISYKQMGGTAISQVLQYSTDNSNWTTGIASFSTTSSVQEKATGTLNVTADNLYIKITGSVSSSTTSARDFYVDDITVTYTAAATNYTIINNLTNMAGVAGNATTISSTAEDLTLTYTANTGYNLPSSVTVQMGSNTLADNDEYTWNSTTGELYLAPTDGFSGNLTITATAVAAPATKTDPSFSIADMTIEENSEDNVPDITTDNTDSYSVTYESDNEEVAYADNGKIVGYGQGTCTITATMGATTNYNQAQTTFNVTVTEAKSLSSIALSGTPTKTNYLVGETFDPTGIKVMATYQGDENPTDVTSQATIVYNDGALTYGTTQIEVAAEFGSKEANQTYTITVKKASAITVANINMTEGDELTISATTTPENAALTYNISQTDNFISIADGKITALKAGTATVTASYTDATGEYVSAEATFTVTVKAPSLSNTVSFGVSESDTYTFASGSDNLLKDAENIEAGDIAMTWTTTSGTNHSYNDGSVVRFYTNNTMTLTPQNNATITKVVFTRSTSSSSNGGSITCKLGSTTKTESTGGSTTTTNTFENLNATSALTFTVGAQVRFSKVEVYYEGDLEHILVPTITSSAGASFTNTTTITITNPTGGTKTYYTINEGETQTYSAPFEVSATSTIKAWAQIASYKSTEASLTVTKVEAPTTIAKWKTIGTGVATTGELTDALVTGINGKNVYVQDATGGAIFYINGDATYPEGTIALAVGDKITGAFTATTTLFNACTFEFTACDFSQATITSGNTVTPEAATVAQLTENFAAYEGKYVKVSGVELTDGTGTSDRTGTIKEGEATFTIYSGESGLETPVVGATVNVTGYVSYGQNASQKEIIFLTAEDVKATALPTTVTFTTKSEKIIKWNPTLVVAESSCSAATVTYSSSDDQVANVYQDEDDGKYYVLGNNPGTATITATTEDAVVEGITYKGNSASFTVKVGKTEYNASIDYTQEYSSTTSGSAKLDGVTNECGNASITFSKGTNQTEPAYYASGTSVRAYKGNTITISAAQPIQFIEIQYTSEKGVDKGYSVSNGTMNINADTKVGTWGIDGAAQTVTYTLGNTCSFSKITIYYEAVSVTISDKCYDTNAETGNKTYYTTYSVDNNIIVPADVTVSEVGVNGEGTLNVASYQTGDIVEGGIGMLISSATAGKKYFGKTADNCTLSPLYDEGTGNFNSLLFGTGDYGKSKDDMESDHADCKFYTLTETGFCWENATGAGFALDANQAYLAIPNTSNPMNYYDFSGKGYKTLALVAQNSQGYWATFSSDKAVEFIDNTTTVYTVNVNGSTLQMNTVESKQVPANTGVLIKSSTNSAAYSYIASATALENNLLKPGTGEMTTGDNCKFYRLAYGNFSAKTGLGFYYGSGCNNGEAFKCKAGTAYLAVPNSSGASELRGFSFDDLNGNETSLKAVETTNSADVMMNLSGQRVEKITKSGLYIVNGNKVIIK